MSRTFIALSLSLLLVASAAAQQLEVNTAGGSLKSNGIDPTPGNPFKVASNGSMSLQVGGAPNQPYILVLANLLGTSLPVVDSQFLDVDLFSPFVTVIDGYGVFQGALPSSFGFTSASGSSSWNIPVNAGLNGQNFDFQAAVADPTLPSGINLTAAASYDIVFGIVQGDDVLGNFVMSSPISLYGQSYTNIAVSTNGWIKFGGSPTNSDLSESAAEFLGGNVGGATAGSGPVIGVLWEDLDMGNRASSMVALSEGPGFVQVSWIDGDYFPSTLFGNVSATITTAGPVTTVVLDYTGYAAAPPPSEGLIGVSDGGSVIGTVATAHDLVLGGAVNPFAAMNPSVALFQSFDGLGTPSVPAEPVDLAGRTLTFTDTTGGGAFSLN